MRLDIKEAPSLICRLSGKHGTCHQRALSITRSFFTPPVNDGLALGVFATRRRLWQSTKSGSCPSVGTRCDDFCVQKTEVPPVLRAPFSHVVFGGLCVPSAGQLPNPSTDSSHREEAFPEKLAHPLGISQTKYAKKTSFSFRR